MIVDLECYLFIFAWTFSLTDKPGGKSLFLTVFEEILKRRFVDGRWGGLQESGGDGDGDYTELAVTLACLVTAALLSVITLLVCFSHRRRILERCSVCICSNEQMNKSIQLPNDYLNLFPPLFFKTSELSIEYIQTVEQELCKFTHQPLHWEKSRDE